MTPSRDPADATAPLTAEQLMWFRVNTFLPVVFTVPMVIFFGAALWFVYRRLGAAMPVKIFTGIGAALLVAVAGGVVLHVRNNRRDMLLGCAYVRRASLRRKYHTSQRSRVFYLEFDSMPAVIVSKEIYDAVSEHQTYRVTYSPHTRRGWLVDQRLS
jgi:hypothetical protein